MNIKRRGKGAPVLARVAKVKARPSALGSPGLLTDVRQLIDSARTRVASAVNAELTLLYWRIGQRVNAEVLQGKRADYGRQIIVGLSQQLTLEYGKGWGDKHLLHCVRLAEVFPDERILYTLCREFSWSHIRALIYIDNSLKRDFYIEIARLEHWSVRQLQERIQSMLFERTAISRKPEETIQRDLKALRDRGKISADLAFRDPYLLESRSMWNYSNWTKAASMWPTFSRPSRRVTSWRPSSINQSNSPAIVWNRNRPTDIEIEHAMPKAFERCAKERP